MRLPASNIGQLTQITQPIHRYLVMDERAEGVRVDRRADGYDRADQRASSRRVSAMRTTGDVLGVAGEPSHVVADPFQGSDLVADTETEVGRGAVQDGEPGTPSR